MYISLNWIKDFVDLEGIDIKEIENRFTLATAEVEGVEIKGKDVKNVVAAKVISVEEKEELKTTRVVRVDTGSEILQTCCGAPNVKVGMIVPCAKVGGSIVGLSKISSRKTAGYESNCILCAERELGISDDYSGLMELPKDTELGLDIKKILDIDDVIIEIDNKSLTNRPDLWGHYGIAREFAAIFKRKLKPLEIERIENNKYDLDIKIKTDKCSRYTGLAIKSIKENKSPLNMQIRLFYCGMRSISLLVDITNYIMLELGQPMHAFDKRDMDRVEVKELENDTKFTTLDDEERVIPKGTMMIFNSKEPVAIAGIMGGQNTEIKDDTTELFLESANFDAGSVRKSAVKLKLRTDASARYEKSLDPELTEVAIKRFIKLLKLVQEDIVIESNITDVYNVKNNEIVIDITKDYIERMVGINFDDKYIVDCLERLEFEVKSNDGKYQIKVPSFRATKDISIKSDIVEEVSRIYGYDNIIPKPIALPIEPVDSNPIKDMTDKVKNILTEKYNANEIHSYVWYDNDFCREINIDPKYDLSIVNSEDGYAARLRTTMIPTMLKVANLNLKNYERFICYEIGSTYEVVSNKTDEKLKLAIVLCDKSKDKQELFYELKSIISNVVKRTKGLNIICDSTNECDYVASGSMQAVIKVNDIVIGKILAVDDAISRKISIKSNIVICEVDMNELIKLSEKKIVYKAPSIYQETNLNFNFLVDKNTYLKEVMDYINEFKTDLEYSVVLLDMYKGKGIPDEKVSYTFGVSLSSYERTLTSNEISEFQNDFIKYMQEKEYVLR